MLDVFVDQLGLNPYAFYGITHSDDTYRSNKVWTREERLRVARAMLSTRQQLEQALGYFILPTYRSMEEHYSMTGRIRLDRPYVIAVGERLITDLPNAVIDYDTEPATIQIATELTDLRLYHPFELDIEGEAKEILPLSKSYSEGVWTMTIPRYRLVRTENNPTIGWDYLDPDSFLTELIVKSDRLSGLQGGYTITIRNAKMGLIDIEEPLCGQPISSDYLSGLSSMPTQLQAVWVKFALAKMPIQPVEDSVVKLDWLWARDIPAKMSTAQIECPFGQHTGAFEAWQYANLHRVFRARPL